MDELLPQIADQIREEVERGKPMPPQRLSADRVWRDVRLAEARLGRIGKSDISVEPYSADERLIVLLQAVQTLAGAMAATRNAVAGPWTRKGVQPASITFSGADEVAGESLDLRERFPSEERELTDLKKTVESLLHSVRAEQ